MASDTHKVTSPKSRGITTILPIKADTHLEELVVKGNRKAFLCFLKQNLIHLLRVSFEKTQFTEHCWKEMNNLLDSPVNFVPFKLLTLKIKIIINWFLWTAHWVIIVNHLVVLSIKLKHSSAFCYILSGVFLEAFWWKGQ